MSKEQQLARQLLALLVMDLGYKNPPTYGHNPVRHQVAWCLAEDIMGEEMKVMITEMAEQKEHEFTLINAMNKTCSNLTNDAGE